MTIGFYENRIPDLVFFGFFLFFVAKSIKDHLQIRGNFLFGASFNSVSWNHRLDFSILEVGKRR